MDNYTNIEVFHIEINNNGTFAYISFQNSEKIGDENNGYDWIRVPMNLRPIQFSFRDNPLVNQSKSTDADAIPETN